MRRPLPVNSEDHKSPTVDILARSAIGASLPRREDIPLLTGRGRFIEDIDRAHQAHAVIVRSPYAHARIASIDASDARACPGVIAALTWRELAEDGIGPLLDENHVRGRGGERTINTPHPLLAKDRVMFSGDPVALIVAERLTDALDAAEALPVDYEELPVVTDAIAACEDNAPCLWPQAPGNLALDWEAGDARQTQAAFDRAAHRTSLRIVNNRVIAAPMENRGVIAEFDPSRGRYTLFTPTQGAGALLESLARSLGVGRADIRVITDDVGGAFGIKIRTYPEHILIAWAARRIARPVKWIAQRTESFVSDGQGRDHITFAELALDEEGRFLAVRTRTVSNIGAYSTAESPTIPTVGGVRCLTGVYRIPMIDCKPINVSRPGERTRVSIRPERVEFNKDRLHPDAHTLEAQVLEFIYMGDIFRTRVRVAGNEDFIIKTRNAPDQERLEPGRIIEIGWLADDCRALDTNA
eukprot:XP_019860884.1 PREDICTED: uncharacterized protein LOC109589217 [Amphimedon queenslandica]